MRNSCHLKMTIYLGIGSVKCVDAFFRIELPLVGWWRCYWNGLNWIKCHQYITCFFMFWYTCCTMTFATLSTMATVCRQPTQHLFPAVQQHGLWAPPDGHLHQVWVLLQHRRSIRRTLPCLSIGWVRSVFLLWSKHSFLKTLKWICHRGKNGSDRTFLSCRKSQSAVWLSCSSVQGLHVEFEVAINFLKFT